jgi:sugar lactone lactonase YvrE
MKVGGKKALLTALVAVAGLVALGAQPASATYTSYQITTYAGMSTAGHSGDGGPATSAKLNAPAQMTFDSSGNMYFAENSGDVRKITPSGTISTVAGTDVNGFSGDGGPATSAQLNTANGVAIDSSGNLYIADYANHRIRKVTAGGTISTFAGTGTAGSAGDGGAATSAQLNYPASMSFDSAGNLYTADSSNNKIRKITPAGIISTVVGTGTASYAGDGGAATSATVCTPLDAEFDPWGNMYIVDNCNNVIRKVTPGGTISTVAGTGTAGFSGDGGPATSAKLNNPQAIVVDGSGNLYIADASNDRIRMVSGGTITTVAGTGMGNSAGDGGLATNAPVDTPDGIGIDANGNLYMSEVSSHNVRKVAAIAPSSGTVSAVATMDPNFAFTIGAHSGACNGAAQSAGTTSSATAISLGHFTSATQSTTAQDLSATTNASQGFSVYIRSTGALSDGHSHTIADLSGAPNSTPIAFPATGTAALGYTTSDATLGTGTVNRFTNGGPYWAGLTTSNAEVFYEPTVASSTACVGFRVGAASSTAGTTYSTSIIYSGVPGF